jgi:hypothetical protein
VNLQDAADMGEDGRAVAFERGNSAVIARDSFSIDD